MKWWSGKSSSFFWGVTTTSSSSFLLSVARILNSETMVFLTMGSVIFWTVFGTDSSVFLVDGKVSCGFSGTIFGFSVSFLRNSGARIKNFFFYHHFSQQ